MKFELKPISHEGIPEALEKVERYRLLNEPAQAESICLDVLRIDPENQKALIMLLLALTDQFGIGVMLSKAREVLPKIRGEYERAYYEGIVWERLAHSQLRAQIERLPIPLEFALGEERSPALSRLFHRTGHQSLTQLRLFLRPF